MVVVGVNVMQVYVQMQLGPCIEGENELEENEALVDDFRHDGHDIDGRIALEHCLGPTGNSTRSAGKAGFAR